MKNIEIVRRLGILSVLIVRDVERNTSLTISNQEEVYDILTKGEINCTYELTIKNLKEFAVKNSKNEKIRDRLELIKTEISNSSIRDMKFIQKYSNEYTDEELMLNREFISTQLKMEQGMYGISQIASVINVSMNTIKSACQEERILNTRKIGKSWLISLEECKEYWN